MNNHKASIVLIETLWNVKRGQVIATPVENIVLIETLWNVKKRDVYICMDASLY